MNLISMSCTILAGLGQIIFCYSIYVAMHATQPLPTALWRPIFILIVCLGLSFPSLAQYTVSSLPHAKAGGQDSYVSNPEGILSAEAVYQLDAISKTIEEKSGTEYTVVVVDDFVGDVIFDFALETFNTWGVGKKGANNGLLLFIAKDRREYRFVSGYGLEAIFPDVYLHRIGEKYLVPNFRAGDYDAGVLEASKAIEQALLAPDVQAELDRMMPEATPFFTLRNPKFITVTLVILVYAGLYYWIDRYSRRYKSDQKLAKKDGCTGWFAYAIFSVIASGFTLLLLMLFFAFLFQGLEQLFQPSGIPYVFALCGSYMLLFKIYEVRGAIKKSYLDEENKLKALKRFQRDNIIPYLFTPLMLFGLFSFQRKWKRSQARFVPPDDSGNWSRVNRDEVGIKGFNKFLKAGQLKEEKLETKYYEVWKNKQTGEERLMAWDGKNTHSVCPSCGFKTYKLRATKVLTAATYSSSGLRSVFNQCANCKHEEDLGTETIPKKVRSSGSGSSSGGGGWSGGSSSSSGGGSFGGGSSGGGGAGGRW